MLKWGNISVLLWRVQATKAGFRLQIHQECSSPCVQMCDVAVDIMVYEDHINCLKPYNDFSGEVSAEIMGSWNDANAYCEQRGMQLMSATSNEEAVGDFSKLVCSLTKQGLLPSELTVFMGLYKSQQVGFCPNIQLIGQLKYTGFVLMLLCSMRNFQNFSLHLFVILFYKGYSSVSFGIQALATCIPNSFVLTMLG